jgi:ferredoxin
MPSLLPYIQKLVNEQEMQLVISINGIKEGIIGLEKIAENMQISREYASKLLKNCELRGIVRKQIDEGETSYTITEFPRRLFNFVTFEKGWDDFPLHIRRILSEWMHRVYYYDRYYPTAEKMKKGKQVSRLPNEDILLLEEVLEMVDAADDFAVATCNCRTLDQNCDFPTQTCIRFNDAAKRTVELDRGKMITKKKMKELIVNLDKKGLMHTGDKNWRINGLSNLCNCCTCCCYPFRAGIELELKELWPRSYYIAEHETGKCMHCGTCVKRCQFGAWEYSGMSVGVEGKLRNKVVYDHEKCWGCGLCANTCPSNTISMKELIVSKNPN